MLALLDSFSDPAADRDPLDFGGASWGNTDNGFSDNSFDLDGDGLDDITVADWEEVEIVVDGEVVENLCELGAERIEGDDTGENTDGGAGNDTIFGFGGNDNLYGGICMTTSTAVRGTTSSTAGSQRPALWRGRRGYLDRR